MIPYCIPQFSEPHNSKNAIGRAIDAISGQVKKLTKQLRLGRFTQAGAVKKKLIVSTNWLPSFGFEPGVRVVEEVSHGLLVIRLAQEGDEDTKLVYQRRYNQRKSNAEEAQLDIRSQARLQAAFGDADEVHITFSAGRIVIRPVMQFADQTIPLGAQIIFPEGESRFAAIAQAASIIHDRKFSRIEFEATEDFLGAREHTFFCMHLRRLGYAITSQGKITRAQLPGRVATGSVDVDLRNGLSEKPEFKSKALSRFNLQDPLNAAGMMTSGVDLACSVQEGFRPSSILEYRPLEERDFDKTPRVIQGEEGAPYCPIKFRFVKKTQASKIEPVTVKTGELNRDFRELGATTAALSIPTLGTIFNEDIYSFDPGQATSELFESNVVIGGLQCDDFSSLKSHSERLKSIDNLGSTSDMLFPALRVIENAMFPVISFENVAPFEKSEEFKVFTGRLQQLGYTVHSTVMRGEEHNSYTRRPRNFIVASLLDSEFNFPQAIEHSVHWWEDIVNANPELMRSLPRTPVSVQSALAEQRMNLMQEGSKICRTLVKSDAKYVKDSVSVLLDGQYYFLPADIMAKTMSIPDAYRYDVMPTEFQRELIGQSVCGRMHARLMQAVKSHIMSWVNRGTREAIDATEVILDRMQITSGSRQLSLW